MDKTAQFGLVMTPTEKAALFRMAEEDRCSAAYVVRRLVWREADERGMLLEMGEASGEASNDKHKDS